MCLLKSFVLLSIFTVALGTVERSGVPLITGGSDAHNQDLSKSIVSLRVGTPIKFWGDNHGCGGTLIAADLVLTAAHCVINNTAKEPYEPDELTVVTGSPFRLKQIDTTVEVKVRKIIIHDGYMNILPTLGRDIAILKLEQRVTEVSEQSAKIMPMIKKPLEANMRCTVAGWGDIFQEGINPPILLYANVTVWSLFGCRVRRLVMTKGIICLSDEEDPHLTGNACNGDSGGPLICEGKLAGIASFITGECGQKNHPAVYTDVYFYRRWIEWNSANKLKMPPFIAVAMIVMVLR